MGSLLIQGFSADMDIAVLAGGHFAVSSADTFTALLANFKY